MRGFDNCLRAPFHRPRGRLCSERQAFFGFPHKVQQLHNFLQRHREHYFCKEAKAWFEISKLKQAAALAAVEKKKKHGTLEEQGAEFTSHHMLNRINGKPSFYFYTSVAVATTIKCLFCLLLAPSSYFGKTDHFIHFTHFIRRLKIGCSELQTYECSILTLATDELGVCCVESLRFEFAILQISIDIKSIFLLRKM